MSKTILVVGATGNYGQPVCRQLKEDGFDVRVYTRKRAKAVEKFGDGFPIYEGTIEEDASLRKALEGCHGVHINLRGWWKQRSHDRVEHRGTANIVRLAREAGVERVTYITNLHARAEYASRFPHLKAKWDAEQAIRASGVPFTIFACAFFMENLHHLGEGSSIRFTRLDRSYHYVAAEDYARILAKAYQTPEAANKRFDLYGPESIHADEAMRLYCSIVRPEAKLTAVPRWLSAIYVHLTRNVNFQYTMRVLKLHQ